MKSRKYNVKRKNTKRKYTGGKKSKQKYLRKKKSKRKYCGGKKSRWCCNPSRWIIKSRKHMYKKAKQGNKGNNDKSNRGNSIGSYNYSNNNRSGSSKPDANCPTFSEMIQESEDNSLRRAVNGIYTSDEPQKWTKVDKTKKELKEELGENGYKSFKEKIAKKKAERARQKKEEQRETRQAIYNILTR